MNHRSFLTVLRDLNRHRFGRNVMNVMTRRAGKLALDREVQDGDEFSVFYERVWRPYGVPDEVREALLDEFDACPECGEEPILDKDEYHGYWRRRAYCSEKCRSAAHDGEDDRECSGCGDWFDTNNGYSFNGEDYCSDDCAWSAFENCHEVWVFFREKHKNLDQTAVMEKAKNLEWWRCDGSQEVEDLLKEAAGQITHCEVCDNVIDVDEGRDIADMEDAAFCSDHCAWEGIAQYLDVLTNRQWSAYQAQQLLKDHVLWELEGPGRLDAALKQKGIG
jgi:hypothetical protein